MRRVSWIQRSGLLSAVAAIFSLVGAANAATVQYVASDLPDLAPGEDLWRYQYTVAGTTFSALQFFDLYFDPLLYGMLTAGPSPGADWDVAVLQQPNPVNLPPFHRGMFDAFALVNNPSLAGTFSVDFVYLGAGTPGSQPFDIFGADSALLQSGVTTPLSSPIPEPSTLTMLLVPGLAMFGVGFYRTRKKSH